MNQVNLVGRMARDPEPTSGEAEGVRFAVAIEDYNPSTKSRDTMFINVVAWGKVSETITAYAAKGREVRITGRLQFRSYTPTKGPHTGHEVTETSVVISGYDGFELLAGKPAAEKEDAPSGW